MLNKTKLATAMALMLASTAGAHANTITLNLNADTVSITPDENDTDSDIGTTSASASSSASSIDFFDFASGNARGNDEGWFYTTASATGEATALSTFLQTYNVTNDGDDQFFNFSFDVLNGSISADCQDFGDYGYGGDFIDEVDVRTASLIGTPSDSTCGDDLVSSALYEAEIKFNGSIVWNSFASITFGGGTYSFDEDGTASLGTYSPFDDGFFGWGKQSFNIDLGLIGAGQSFNIEYSITTLAVSGIDINSQGDFIDGIANLNAYSQFGDPNSFQSQAVAPQITGTPATSVNAPGTLAVFGLSLLALGRLARRKAQLNA